MNRDFNSKRYDKAFHLYTMDEVKMRSVLELIGKNKKVIDLGCGDGFMMERIRSAGNSVDGVEICTAAVGSARKKGFTVYDLNLNHDWAKEIPAKYDVAFGGEIIEHIFDTDKFLKNIKEVLKPKGALILTTPNLASLGRKLLLLLGLNPHIENTARATDAGHIRYFIRQTLKALLTENKFRVLTMTSTVVNLDPQGKIASTTLARFFPSLGNNIIVSATA